MLISAVVVGLVVALMAVLIGRSLILRAPAGRRAAPKRARKKAPAPRNLHLVVNKNDMDRELAALLGKERARPPDPDAR
jgi:hypothetical protein